MFNLLPHQEKKKIKRMYRLRFFALCLTFLFGISIASFVFLLPTYIISKIKTDSYVEKYALAEETENQKLETVVAQTKKKMTLLKNENYYVGELITDLLRQKEAGIVIKKILYKKEEGGAEITWTGVARTRPLLIDFIKKLEGESHVASVDVPLSFLAKQNELDFTMKIKVKP